MGFHLFNFIIHGKNPVKTFLTHVIFYYLILHKNTNENKLGDHLCDQYLNGSTFFINLNQVIETNEIQLLTRIGNKLF